MATKLQCRSVMALHPKCGSGHITSHPSPAESERSRLVAIIISSFIFGVLFFKFIFCYFFNVDAWKFTDELNSCDGELIVTTEDAQNASKDPISLCCGTVLGWVDR